MYALPKPLVITLFAALTSTLLLLAGCNQGTAAPSDKTQPSSNTAVAIFAGGCFWCVESDFEKVTGVIKAISGYTGGEIANPTYKQVSSSQTRHVEAVEVHYNPMIISYSELLDHFWRQIDPTDNGGQFVDRGHQYSPFVFVHDEKQKSLVEASLATLKKSGRYNKPLVVAVVNASVFYSAEDYHQDYYKKNPLRYKYYRYNSGRDQYLKETWGDDLKIIKPISTNPQTATGDYTKPSKVDIKNKLTSLQYDVTQKDATERPFNNKYWDNKKAGIYVDVVSGEPLFSSLDKFVSKTGWPSFTQPIESRYIVEKTDYKMIFPRTEVRSYFADSHLGHVFNDGPEPTGQRYCINSASMRFIKKDDLDKEGYGKYIHLFDQ